MLLLETGVRDTVNSSSSSCFRGFFSLNGSVQVSQFDEGFDVKLRVNGPSMTTSDTMRLLRKVTKGSKF